jgi:hypothetical protein
MTRFFASPEGFIQHSVLQRILTVNIVGTHITQVKKTFTVVNFMILGTEMPKLNSILLIDSWHALPHGDVVTSDALRFV